jgi:hypothetical protein
MKGGSANIPDPDLAMANTEAEEYSTNQEASVLPWLAGEQKVALRWISPVYNQFTKEAPVERPGKK